MEEFATPEELASLSKEELSELEELAKSCPRCGKPSANKSNPQGRCRACLKKLAANKKKPGHWQRAQTKADDSLRRQDGKNGTAHKKSKGRGTRKEIVNKIQRAEKKTGEKLSPDRVNNGRGYTSSNVRAIPERLNVGRHKADPKKLAAWKKRIKKSDVTSEFLYTALLAKAVESDNKELLTLLRVMDQPGIEQYLQLSDTTNK